MLVCPNCGEELDLSEVEEVCTNCGVSIPVDLLIQEEEESNDAES